MRVDVYKRPDHAGRQTYLVVPEGKAIPQEATNTDWQQAEWSYNLDENEDAMPQFAIDQPLEQISSKGYAITSMNNLDKRSNGM